MSVPLNATTDEGAGEGATPRLTLDGYHGSLAALLTLARRQKIDLATISLLELVDQLAAAMQDAPAATPMGQKADWLVMASWLVQLRSRLLLPADAPVHQAAQDAADRLRNRLSGLAEIQALATWLDDRPVAGDEMPALRKRGAWASTLIAGLELAKQGDVRLAQAAPFTVVHVTPALTEPPD
jgi:chromatin segregation and condensation protein Rec8/ScpA/Scc1 (kleisin family)